tara:strand:+ start:7150 stop:8550 length:1401 start_codon:yes stop_codon:yes gene_type:complete
MNNKLLIDQVGVFWEKHIIPTLFEYIKIPNKSPSFDVNWKQNGHMDKVLHMAKKWAEEHLPKNAELIIKESPEKTPLLLIDIAGTKDGNILMYGHLDKQPEMEGWNNGLGPWDPVLKDGKLYGRGGADDGYALFASMCAIKALLNQGLNTPRILILIEFSEESGSPDLPHYIELCSDLIGKPELVICLDSGAGDYKRFWTTTSLRGLIGCSLEVGVLKEGVHSGGASGHVPSSFRIARLLLSRLEDERSGEIKLNELHTTIPDYRVSETERFVDILGREVVDEFPWKDDMEPSTDDLVEGVLRRTWRPALSVVGANGLPPSENAGNVLRPYTKLQLSIRIPPMVDQDLAQEVVVRALSKNVPHKATVVVECEEAASGWSAPETSAWLVKAINKASLDYFEEQDCSMSEGGTIPFMAMLGERFPDAQFVITGVLGPGSNAHGPNEFLHIPYAKKLTCCIASIINDFQ